MSMVRVLLLLTLAASVLAQNRNSRRSRRTPPPATHVQLRLNECPRGVLQRKEYRDMSGEEWRAFRDALLSIQLSPSPDGGSYTEWDWWTRMHLDHVPEAHDHPAFFPWHRLYLSMVEKRLQEINPMVTIPYWDWSYDWADPLKSPLFSTELGMDVAIGAQGDCRYRRNFPRQHCLARNYSPREFTSFYPSPTINAIIKSARNYDQFRQRIEYVPHGIVHASVGGQNGDMTAMHSPNDPIFWLHHSNVDRLWNAWQQSGARQGRRRSRAVNPLLDYGGQTRQGQAVSISDILAPFDLAVNDTLATESLCYSYAPFSRWTTTDPELKEPTRIPSGRRRLLPRPIPEDWIQMHGLTVAHVRTTEDLFRQVMISQLQQPEPSSVAIDEGGQVTVTVTGIGQSVEDLDAMAHEHAHHFQQ